MNWMEQLFGSSTPQNKMLDVPKRPVGWTTSDELANAKKYDSAYGDRSAAFFQPGTRMRMAKDYMEMRSAFNNDAIGKFGLQAIDPEMADRLYSAWLAAQSSPTAAVGYDPRQFATAARSVTQGRSPDVLGEYDRKKDQIFTTGQHDSTFVHESIHRGMKKLRDAGMMPDSAKAYSEEILTRALMQKYFGGVEQGRGDAGDRQVAEGKRFTENPIGKSVLNDIENASSKLYASARPRGGPR
jgi:hypothetical protein